MDSEMKKKWYAMRRCPHDPVWDKYEVFAAWCKETGFKEGFSLYRDDAAKPYGPTNCHWSGTDIKRIQKDKTAKEFIYRWNKTVNRFRKVVGLRPFSEE